MLKPSRVRAPSTSASSSSSAAQSYERRSLGSLDRRFTSHKTVSKSQPKKILTIW